MYNIKQVAKQTHDGLGAVLAYIAPLLAPLPSAIAIWSATGNIIIAIVVESLGFSATAVALRTYRHNKEQPERPFPLWLPIGMFAIYFATTILIIVAAETLPAWAAWHTGELPAWTFLASIAPALYPLLTMVGAGVYALVDSLDHFAGQRAEIHAFEHAQQDLDLERRRREMEIELEQKQAEAHAKLEERRLKLEAKLSQDVPVRRDNGTSTTGETVGQDEKMGRIEAVIETTPYASLTQISEITGVPKSTAGRLLKKAGYHKNGNGWEAS